jgi:cytochrome P450
MVAVADVICFPGFESTAHSLVWVIYDLMRNQKVKVYPNGSTTSWFTCSQIYERLVSELDAAVMTYGEQEYLKSSATIPYLEACIKARG